MPAVLARAQSDASEPPNSARNSPDNSPDMDRTEREIAEEFEPEDAEDGDWDDGDDEEALADEDRV